MQVALLVLPSAWLLSSQGGAESFASREMVAALNVRTAVDIAVLARDWALGFTLARPLTVPDVAMTLSAVALLGIGAVSWWRSPVTSQEREIRALALVVSSVPFLAAFPLPFRYTARYFSFAAPAIYLLWAQGLCWLMKRGALGVLAAVSIVLPFFAFGDVDALSFVKDEYGLALDRVSQQAPANAGLVLNGAHQQVMYTYYADGAVRREAIIVPSTTTWPPEDQWNAQLEDLLARHNETWLVMMQLWQVDNRDRVERWLNQYAYQAEKSYYAYDTQTARYFTPSSGDAAAGSGRGIRRRPQTSPGAHRATLGQSGRRGARGARLAGVGDPHLRLYHRAVT